MHSLGALSSLLTIIKYICEYNLRMKRIFIMDIDRIHGINSERLRKIIRKHLRTRKIALNAYRRYQNPRLKREFRSRINRIDTDEYLDISYKPNLNVIILVIDSLRNSRLSCQGYFRETTPFMDSFKSRFRAISASPWTYPSVGSILTGLYPHNHNALLAGKVKDWTRYESYLKLRDDILTLPEILFLLGYRIYFGTAIPPAYWAVAARAVPKISDASTVADVVLNDLTKWIAKKRRQKFFAYVQLADLHPPINLPSKSKSIFGDVKPLPRIDKWDYVKFVQQEADAQKFREYKENRQLLYDNALRYVDGAVERFYNHLKNMGLVDSTVFMVTADHGEQFWEHAELDARSFYLLQGVCGISHGDSAYNEVIEVPLLISGPVPDTKPDHFISTVDIMPTIIDTLGINHSMRFDGRNIFKAGDERPLLSEAVSCGYEKKALVIGRYKLIYAKDDGIEWLFDLEKDPQEQQPIVDKEVTSVFVEKLLQMLREDERRRIQGIVRKKIYQTKTANT